MHSVKCPVPGCAYTTGDYDAVVIAALLNAHCVVHGGTGGAGAVLDASSSTVASRASVSSEGILSPHLRVLAEEMPSAPFDESETQFSMAILPTPLSEDPLLMPETESVTSCVDLVANMESAVMERASGSSVGGGYYAIEASSGGRAFQAFGEGNPSQAASRGRAPQASCGGDSSQASGRGSSALQTHRTPETTPTSEDPQTSQTTQVLVKNNAEQAAGDSTLLRLEELGASTRAKLLGTVQGSFGRSDWSAITSAVYGRNRERNAYYPEDYYSLAKDIIKMYPAIKESLTEEQATKTLASRLKNKFKNRRKASGSPSVVAKRRSLVKKLDYGLPGYLPRVENSEIDDQKTVNTLKEDDITSGCVSDGMDSTFPLRRKQVVKEKMAVRKMKKTYPRLFSLDQMWEEMRRITHHDLRAKSVEEMARWLNSVCSVTGCIKDIHIRSARIWVTGQHCY